MKKFMLLTAAIAVVGFTSCDKDDDDNNKEAEKEVCVSCTVANAPAIKICKGENGNAFVQGTDTNAKYDAYVSSLKTAGATCK